MNREIKFRAWDKEIKVMRNHEYLFNPGSSSNYQNPFSRSDIKLMQYTGLKDTTGKELYEDDLFEDKDGDILRCWIDDGVMLAGGTNKEWDNYLTSTEVMKIVGNIYEKPIKKL